MGQECNHDLRKIKIAFLGLGGIGTELMNIICTNKGNVMDKYGVEIEFGKILVRDLSKKRNTVLKELELTTHVDDIVNDESVDIVVECMGGVGVHSTRDSILSVLERRKSVVMSSKKCLAMYGNQIIEAAIKNKVNLHYDASVGGCIPISNTLKSMAQGEKIERIYGILNGTSNYIYTLINEENRSYEEALLQAQLNGYAEDNPSEDIEGADALFKLVILSGFGLKKWIDYKTCKPVSLSYVGTYDFEIAKHHGYVIKPLSIAQVANGTISCYVGPCLLSKDTLLSQVKYNNNMIMIESTWSGRRAFYGQGAGARPTASAMFDDLISIIENKSEVNQQLLAIQQSNNTSEWQSDFYVRMIGSIHEESLKECMREKNIEIKMLYSKQKTAYHYTEFMAYNTSKKDLEEITLSLPNHKELMVDVILPYIEV